MQKNAYVFLVILFLSISFLCQANNEIDDLEKKLENAVSDTAKVDQLCQLALKYLNEDIDSAKMFQYINKAELISKKNSYQKGTARCYLLRGGYYYRIGKYQESLHFHLKSLQIYEVINFKKGLADCYLGTGNVYYGQLNYKNAINNYFHSLNLYRDIKIEEGVKNSLNNIGGVYYDKAEYDSAIYYFNQSLELEEKAKNKMGIAESLGNLGTTYTDKKDYNNAILYLTRALSIHNEMRNKDGIAIALANLAQVFQQKGDYTEALNYLEKSISISSEIGRKEYIKEAYSAIAEIYTKQGNFQKACDYQNLLMQLKDTIYSIESNKNIAEMQTKFDTEKKEKENQVLKQENEIQVLNNTRQKLISYSVTVGLILMIALAFFIFRGYKQKQAAHEKISKQKEVIEEKNKEILDSITYAKRLQDAILPPLSLVKKHLPESFVLYKPKDIVAGDFYWMHLVESRTKSQESRLKTQESRTILIAAADCTGHGVPGAMVSVVCSNALNRAVKEFGIVEPANILNKVRELVVETFEKSESEVKDGMDISLCSFNINTQELQWAGAYNPLWIVTSTNKQLTEIKADKQPIGKFDAEKPFTNHSIQLQRGDTVYIYTDGYADQFGGAKKKKFKYKQLQELILSFQECSMNEQKEVLNKTITDWQGELEQVDDICIIGIRI